MTTGQACFSRDDGFIHSRQHFPEQSADTLHYIYEQPFNPLIGFFCSLSPNEMNSYKHLKLSQALAPVL